MNIDGSHLPLFIFSIVIFLVLIVNQDSASAIDYTNEVTGLITKSCSGTDVPNICVSILEADSRSKAATDLKSLSRVAIDILREKINETISLFAKAEKNVTDIILKRNIESCIKVLYEGYYAIEDGVIPNFESGDYKHAEQDFYWCASSADSCQDLGTQFFSKEVETLYNFSVDMMYFMDMLSS
ncbi:hypothetical protein Ddye_031213 [Dipteronia dyeriana]|uniref:Pectinesterase inhibitor domain-containing protein n=1 Tax=Dipteronia dyeriana TaxID=168575 RepID=A0AAD9WMC9_9ROSI|nr:hypothetical protein Ddye_031213 [Dipteronia dyeriana]